MAEGLHGNGGSDVLIHIGEYALVQFPIRIFCGQFIRFADGIGGGKPGMAPVQRKKHPLQGLFDELK